MQLSDDNINSNPPVLESLLTGKERSVETEIDDEDEVYIPDIIKESEGLICIADFPMRMYVYIHYLLTFSWLNLCYRGTLWKLVLFCKIICQLTSILIMLLALASEIVVVVLVTYHNSTSTSEYVNGQELINSFILNIGYNLAAVSSLVFLIYYSYSSKRELSPHKLIVETKKNRRTVRRIYSNQIIRNSMRGNVDFKINTRTGITCNSSIIALWQIGISMTLVALISTVYVLTVDSVEKLQANNGGFTNCSSAKIVICQEIHFLHFPCLVSEILIAVNAIQRFLSPVIVCHVSRVACKKIESEIKLNSTDTYTKLVITPNNTDIKGRYFRIVRHISNFSKRFRFLTLVNALCSLLGVAGVAIVRDQVSCSTIAVYVSYLLLLSCAWMALQGIRSYSEMFKRYPDEVFGFMTANKNVDIGERTQAELNIVANSATRTQGSYFSSGVLSALMYSLIAGMVVIVYFLFEGIIGNSANGYIHV